MIQVTPHNILRHELIGLNVQITHSKDPTMRGVKGTIIDESRNMLKLVHRGRKVLVPKDVGSFRFKLTGGTVVDVDGTRLVARPENRLKTKVKRW